MAQGFYLIDLSLTKAITRQVCLVDLSLTKAIDNGRRLFLTKAPNVLNMPLGYIAGTGNGIVTVAGKPAQAEVLLFDASQIWLGVSHRTHSLPNGQYLLRGLNPAKRYLIMARDYQGEYEPYCYDHVAPATDLTLDEQQALWQQMVNQTSQT